MKRQKRTPKAILISDVHFSLKNLELSDKAFRAAIDHAAELKVPLIDCGDITNDKAILRAEVVNAMLDTFKYAYNSGVTVYCLVGNHSRLHEKDPKHALEFLRPYATIVDEPIYVAALDLHLFPYSHDPVALANEIATRCAPGDTLVMHQGLTTGDKGDYVMDTSAIDMSMIEDYWVFSGHYHHHQKLGNYTFVGNPFTMSFGEAKDGPKGILVLYSDNSFEQIVLPYRRHIVLEYNTSDLYDLTLRGFGANSSDLLWIKLKGTAIELAKIKKSDIAKLVGHQNFKLDKIATEVAQLETEDLNLTDEQVLDALIDGSPESEEQKKSLKKLWREVLV
jgi:DNA repair exonuclease SbcCD nuclease subunit